MYLTKSRLYTQRIFYNSFPQKNKSVNSIALYFSNDKPNPDKLYLNEIKRCSLKRQIDLSKGSISVDLTKNLTDENQFLDENEKHISINIKTTQIQKSINLLAFGMAIEQFSNSDLTKVTNLELHSLNEYPLKVFGEWVYDWRENGYVTQKKDPIKNREIIKHVDNILTSDAFRSKFIDQNEAKILYGHTKAKMKPKQQSYNVGTVRCYQMSQDLDTFLIPTSKLCYSEEILSNTKILEDLPGMEYFENQKEFKNFLNKRFKKKPDSKLVKDCLARYSMMELEFNNITEKSGKRAIARD